MAYGYQQIGDLIDQLKGSGNEAQAWAMFNGLSGMGDATAAAGGVAGNLDSYLRTRWGDSAAKQWVNNMDTKYGNTLFDPKTGQWAGMGQANGQKGTIAGWDPSMYNAGGMGVGGQGYTPEGYGSGAGGFEGYTGIGVQGDGKTPMPEGVGGTDWMYGNGGSPGGRTPTFGTKGGGVPGTGGGLPPGGGFPGGGTPPMTGGGTPPAWQGGNYTAPGRGPDAGSPWDFFNDEGYQFRLKEGMAGINGNQAAQGMLQSGKTLKDLASFNSGLASQEYGQAFDRFTNARNFNEDQFRNDRDFGRSNYQDDRNFSRGAFQNDRDYGRSVYRDDRDFGENSRRYNQDFSENSRRYDQGFNEDRRRNDRDFDFSYGRDERDYLTGLDRYNDETGYSRGINDRNWQTSTMMDLARLGLGATGSSGNLADSLSRMFGNNTMTGAGAEAAGAMGNANNMNSLISQIMQYLSGQNMVNQVTGGGNP
jgi:hypothetical protein